MEILITARGAGREKEGFVWVGETWNKTCYKDYYCLAVRLRES